jgi:hypothetical protein
MPDYDRHAPDDDLDIATRVMDTVQRQVGAYRDALLTVRRLRRQIIAHEEFAPAEEQGSRQINTPEKLAEFFEEHGIPRPLSVAFAAEDFAAMGGSFASDMDVEAATWTWECCCSACCITCSMATKVTGCTGTFVQ